MGIALTAAALLAASAAAPSHSADPGAPLRPGAFETAERPRTPQPQAPRGDAGAEPAPVRIAIEAIDVAARLMPVGLDSGGRLEQPPLDRPRTAGWYRLGAAPGQAGPAVIAGHRDTRTGPSVFLRLGELARGDTVHVDRADGSTAVFEIRRSQRVDKDRFPAAEVYGPVDHAALRLITCTGPFNRATGRYEQNLIVYGRLIGDREPARAGAELTANG